MPVQGKSLLYGQDVGAMLKAGRSILAGRMYPNMDELPELSIGTVLANVEALYLQEQSDKPGGKKFSPIYSQVGPVLIALNPFCSLPCYGRAWQDAFRNEGQMRRIHSAWQRFGPHCFGTIEEVYQGLRHSPSQSVVICGESGAGKTVTNGKMLGYLLDIGSQADRGRAETMTLDCDSRTDINRAISFAAGVDERKMQLQAANELLEFFGNAKTGRNDNSSRFGKYSQLYFEGDPYVVVGLKIDHYLLERSRVVSIPKGERNYHIMHMLADVEREHLMQGRKKFKPFRYLQGAGDVRKADGSPFDSLEMYNDCTELMAEAGFDEDLQAELFDSIKGCLYLGNIVFEDTEVGTNDRAAAMKSESDEDLREVCRLLGIDEQRLRGVLMQKVIKADGQVITVPVDAGAASALRDTLAKTVYSRFFDEVIDVINSRLGNHLDYTQHPCIGLLDIFGFEDMPVNGFEQLFINLTNEWIQHHFNTVMFKKELEVYREEDIQIVFEKPDNWPCVELFISERNPSGILKLLQDRVTTPNAKDGKDFVDSTLNRNLKDVPYYTVCDPRLVQRAVQAKQPKFPKVKINIRYEECFQVSHYAGDVIYTVQEFISKSRDAMPETMLSALQNSWRPKIADLFSKEAAEEQGEVKKEVKTVGQHFKKQLKGLMDTLEQSSSIFVRCIKPNAEMKPGNFDERLVLEQLTCGGVVSALEMRSAGLPDRVEYASFIREFWGLERRGADRMEMRKRVQDIMERLIGPEDGEPARFRCGIKRVFMRSGILTQLREILSFILKRSALIVQRKWRAKKGISFVARIDLAKQKLHKVEEEAENANVDGCKTVVVALNKVNAALNINQEKTKHDRSWDLAVGARDSVRSNNILTKAQEKGAGRITKCLDERDLANIEGLIQSAQDVTAKAGERRKKAEAKLEDLLTKRKQEANEHFQRVVEVERRCTNDKDDGERQIKDVCLTAKAKIENVIRVELPNIMKEALSELSFDDDNEEVELPDEVDELLSSTAELCANAELCAGQVIEKKRRFEQEAFEASPEVKELAKKRQEAKERLGLLEDDAKQAVLTGLTAVADALAEVYRLDEVVEELRQSASDPQQFLQAIRDFLKAEEAAQEALRTMRRLEKEAQERELQNLQNIILAFPKSREIQQVARAYLGLLSEFRLHIQSMAAKEQSRAQGLSTQEPTRMALDERLRNAAAATEALGLEVVDDNTRSDTSVLFHYSGPWSAECFKLLGRDVKPYEGMAKVLNESRFESVVDTVEALNAGLLKVEDGFCIGWSETWQQYYLLFQKEKREAAMQACESTEVARKEAAAKVAKKKFQQTIRGALDAEDRKKIEENIAKQRQQVEDRIREAVANELDECYKAEANVQIRKAKADIQAMAESKISQAVKDSEAKAAEEIDKARREIEEKSALLVQQAKEEAAKVLEEAADIQSRAQSEVAKAYDEARQAQQKAQEEVTRAQEKAQTEARKAHEEILEAQKKAQELAAKAQEELAKAKAKASEDVAEAQAKAHEEAMKVQEHALEFQLKANEEASKVRGEIVEARLQAQDEVAKAHEALGNVQLKAQDQIAKVNEELSRVKLKAQEQVAKAQDELLQAQQQAQEANLKAHQEIAAAQLKAKDEVHKAHMQALDEVSKAMMKAKEEAAKAYEELAKAQLQAKDEVSRAQTEARETVLEAHLKAQEDVANVQLQAEKELAALRMRAERDLQCERVKVEQEVAKLRQKVESEFDTERRKAEVAQRWKAAAAESEKQEAERLLTEQMSDLKKKLQHQQEVIARGIADIPSVCIGLGSSASACDRVIHGMNELRRQIVAGGENLKEAIQRTTALQHNPDKLPNLDETVQAVARAQKSCLEVEILCEHIGISNLAPELADIRDNFDQLLTRCQGMAENKGSVALADEETARISGDLEVIVGLLLKLRDGFEKWSTRIGKVRSFIQNAQDQLGMTPEEVWSVIEKTASRTSGAASPWDSMMFGMQSSFCANAREPKARNREAPLGAPAKIQLQGSKKAYSLAESFGLDSPEKILDWSRRRQDPEDTDATHYSVVTDSALRDRRPARPPAWSTFTTHGLDGPSLERRGMVKMQLAKMQKIDEEARLQKLNDDGQPSSYPGAQKKGAPKRPEGATARVGDPVVILPGRQLTGIVRFSGYTDFAAGEWVGVELHGPLGKNDGSVNGVYYFECKALHGLFCRPNLVEKVAPSAKGGDRIPRMSKS